MLSSSAIQDLLRMVMDRFSQASNASELTTRRLNIWLMYLNEFEHNVWLTLIGEGYTSVTLAHRASHNTIIQGVFQFGLIGFPILCIWMIFMLKSTKKGMLCRRRLKYALLLCIGVALPWMALDILFFDEFFLLPVYIVIGILYSNHSTEHMEK